MAGARLIVNADDFGLTRGINRAIARTLRGWCAYFSHAHGQRRRPSKMPWRLRADSHPGLGIGCHIVLTDGIPLSEPKNIPSLLGPDGRQLSAFARWRFCWRFARPRAGRRRLPSKLWRRSSVCSRPGSASPTWTRTSTRTSCREWPGLCFAVRERAGIGAVRNPFEQNWSLAVTPLRPDAPVAGPVDGAAAQAL